MRTNNNIRRKRHVHRTEYTRKLNVKLRSPRVRSTQLHTYTVSVTRTRTASAMNSRNRSEWRRARLRRTTAERDNPGNGCCACAPYSSCACACVLSYGPAALPTSGDRQLGPMNTPRSPEPGSTAACAWRIYPYGRTWPTLQDQCARARNAVPYFIFIIDPRTHPPRRPSTTLPHGHQPGQTASILWVAGGGSGGRRRRGHDRAACIL